MILTLPSQAATLDIQTIQESLSAYPESRFLYSDAEQAVFFVPDGFSHEGWTQAHSQLSTGSKTLSAPKHFPLASRQFKSTDTQVQVGGEKVDHKSFTIMAGPCSIESEQQIFETAEHIASLGLKFIRGGAYKPRSSPYSFQGLGLEGLKLIRQAADKYNLLVVTEVLDSTLIDEVMPYADVLQIGSRNMQNYYFLKLLAQVDKPILLKRGMYSRIEEWLMAAEYLLAGGNKKVILCERGIRTFDNTVRNTFDINCIPLIKQMSHLPIIADPSHATGNASLVVDASMAAVAAGAAGLLVEIHPDPKSAKSDGEQTLTFEAFSALVAKVQSLHQFITKL